MGGSRRPAVVVLLVLGVLCVLVELQSPSLVLWTGQRVEGTNDGGIVYYTVAGEQRTVNAQGEPPLRPEPVTVYADPEDSSRDRVASPAKWIDAVFVVAPFVAAGVLVLAPRRRPAGLSPGAGGPRPSRSSRSR